MGYSAIDVRPLAGACGAEVFGADVSKPLDNRLAEEIHRAWLDHHVLVFRDQSLTPKQQVAFARRFGQPNIYPFVKGLEEEPHVIALVKEPHETKGFGERWHSDTTYLPNPPIATMLYGVDIPAYGGDTMFASAELAYERLSDGLKRTLEPLVAVNSAALDYAGGRAGRMQYANIGVTGQDKMDMEAEHPVVRVHPETGKKSIYVNQIHTKRFKGWTAEESRNLLAYLFDFIVRPEHTCRVRWAKGSLTVWDNRSVQHVALNDYHGQRREAHRVTIEGEPPR
ncbi:MAG: TauD/TfdA family dioxygenase [Alphaproteobacteria bacterium]